MSTSSLHAFDYGRSRIVFRIVPTDKDRLQITVHPDMQVEVQAPHGKPFDAVLLRVKKRASWIVKQLQFFEQFQPLPVDKQFVGGETFRYLGRQYKLKIYYSPNRKVHLSRPFLIVQLPDPKHRAAVETLILRWYHERAKARFDNRLKMLYESASRHLPLLPRLLVRRMSRRWGSCNCRDSIVLNTALIQTPSRCIDYVIIHELCHLRHPSHSPSFFKLLQRLMPDWRNCKAKLELSASEISPLVSRVNCRAPEKAEDDRSKGLKGVGTA